MSGDFATIDMFGFVWEVAVSIFLGSAQNAKVIFSRLGTVSRKERANSSATAALPSPITRQHEWDLGAQD